MPMLPGMVPTIPYGEPASVVAGDTLKWRIAGGDYLPADGWSIAYTFVGTGGKKTAESAASGDDHLITIANTETSNWTAGTYAWQRYAQKSGERYTIGAGSVDVAANLSAVTAAQDTRTHAAKMLASIEAWLEGSDPGVGEWEIETGGGKRKIKNVPGAELLKLRMGYKREIAAEKAAARVASGMDSPGRIIRVRI